MKPRIIKIVVKKNYLVTDYEDPPKFKIKQYKRKEIVDRNGYRNLLTIAIMKDGNTIATSYWRPLNKPKAKRLLRYYLKYYPNKVKFENEDTKNEILGESIFTKRSVLEYCGLLYG